MPSVMPLTAGPMAAPAMAVAICEADTSQNDCESRITAEASTVQMPGTMTYSRLRDVPSISAPAGAVTAMPAMPPMLITRADQAVVPAVRHEEHAQERTDPGLHVGHEEVQRLQRENGPPPRSVRKKARHAANRTGRNLGLTRVFQYGSVRQAIGCPATPPPACRRRRENRRTGGATARRSGRLREQLAVAALLDDAAVVEHDQPVHLRDGGEPVRDGDHGLAGHQRVEARLDRGFDFAVERRGRLVEHQDRRVLEDDARDGDALALAAGQLDAALADMGVVAAAVRASPRGRR